MTIDETIDALTKLKHSDLEYGHGNMVVKIRYEDHYISESEEYPEIREVKLTSLTIEGNEVFLEGDYPETT